MYIVYSLFGFYFVWVHNWVVDVLMTEALLPIIHLQKHRADIPKPRPEQLEYG